MKPLVLCVDDELAVLNQLSAQLERAAGAAYSIECAQSAEEALALIEAAFDAGGAVALVICDQVMPGMKGDRFLESVHRSHPEVMKVLLTGRAGLESAIHAINHAGLHRYLEKPWEAADLARTVETLLAQHRLRDEVARQHRRLEALSRDLRGLHEVGLRIASARDRPRVLSLAVEAARRIVPEVAVYARAGRREAANWWLLPSGLPPGDKTAVEAALAGGAPLVADGAVPIAHGEARYGWLLGLAPDASEDQRDLLQVLAGQAGAALAGLELEEQRLESERLTTVGRMMAGIVHDFRNPMTAIKGYAGMLEEPQLSAEKRHEFARLIAEEAERMSAMAGEVLEFTGGGAPALEKRPVAVAELAHRLQRVLLPELHERRVAFQPDLRYAGPVSVDADRLLRALLNLAGNALDAMEAGGTLRLTSSVANGQLELTLSDTGHGIPEDVVGRVFEPFFTHGKPRGIGLGLAIARRIAEEHGGTLQLASRPGEGTAILLRLPLDERA